RRPASIDRNGYVSRPARDFRNALFSKPGIRESPSDLGYNSPCHWHRARRAGGVSPLNSSSRDPSLSARRIQGTDACPAEGRPTNWRKRMQERDVKTVARGQIPHPREAASANARLPLEPMDPQVTSIQPGGGVVVRLELAWGRLRRWYLKT